MESKRETSNSLGRFSPSFIPLTFDIIKLSDVNISPIHCDELLYAWLVLDTWIVQAGVEHDDGKAEHVAGVGVGEDVRVELTIALGKSFHHTVNLLSFAWQSEAPEELPQSLDKN